MLLTTEAREWFLIVIRSLLHRPYLWGGDDPSGFDCSGLVVEGLRSAGMIGLDEDFSADDLWEHFKTGHIISKPVPGALAFWFNSQGKATHIAVCVGPYHCITADGGGSHIRSLEDAIKDNAFVKVRPINHRQTDPKFLEIFSG